MLKSLKLIICSLILLCTLAPGSVVFAKDKAPNWKLVIIFHEQSVGTINRIRDKYELVWVRRGKGDRELIKQVKAEAKAKAKSANEKTSIYTLTLTTNTPKLVAIYNYSKEFGMWKGSPKPFTTHRMQYGSTMSKLREKINNMAEEYNHTNVQLIKVFHTAAAKRWLNSKENTQNPYYGMPPTLTGPNPCDKDKTSAACKAFSKKPVGSVKG
jgi:hypothetical protein